MNGLFVLDRRPVAAKEFVAFWEARYRYPRGELYDDNIGKPLNPQRVRELYLWKNGRRLSAAKEESIKVNFVERIEETNSLPKDMPPGDFLRRFSKGGAIWRIFWLHIWQPGRYPIFDQHVYRAMLVIETGHVEEIPGFGPSKISTYLNEFLPFFEARFGRLDPRRVDRALWTLGRTVKQIYALTGPAADG